MRRTVGVALLAVSVIISLVDLSGRLHPLAIRWHAHGGFERTVVRTVGSLVFRATLLIAGALAAFWPRRNRPL